MTVSGSAFISSFRDVEATCLRGSQANDNFNLSSFMNGSSLTVDGGAGGDALNVGFSSPGLDLITGDLKAYFLLSGFTFNGGEGYDVFTMGHGNNPAAWTYTRTEGYVDASENAAGRYTQRFHNSAEVVTIGAGSLADVFNVEGAPSGSMTNLAGGLGADQFTVRGDMLGSLNLQEIRGGVQFQGDGSDLFFINNRFDSVGRTYHVNPTRVGDEPGDDLFGPGGYLEFVGTGQELSITNGVGADTVVAVPNPFMQLRINGRDPTANPGDVLRLALAANPVWTPQGIGAGTYTFSNAAPLAYLGFETVIATSPGDFDGNGVVDGADLGNWRAGFGAAGGATPAQGDGDADGDVDGNDFLAWQRGLGFGGSIVAVQPHVTAALEAAPKSIAAPTDSAPAVLFVDLASTVSASSGAIARAQHRRGNFEAIDRVLSAFGDFDTTRDDHQLQLSNSAAKAWPSGQLRKFDAQPARTAAFDVEPLTSSVLESAFGHWA